MLIPKGADVNICNNYGNTALIKPILNGNGNIVALLIQCGANVNAENAKRESALSIAKMLVSDKTIHKILDDKCFSSVLSTNYLKLF